MEDIRRIELIRPRRERHVMLRFTDEEYNSVLGSIPDKAERAVFLRELLLSVLPPQNIVISLTDDEMRLLTRNKPDGMDTGPFLRNQLVLLTNINTVLLHFSATEMERIQATKTIDEDTVPFIRKMIMKSLDKNEMPMDFGRAVAFILSSVSPDISFEDALISYNNFVVDGVNTDEIHKE